MASIITFLGDHLDLLVGGGGLLLATYNFFQSRWHRRRELDDKLDDLLRVGFDTVLNRDGEVELVRSFSLNDDQLLEAEHLYKRAKRWGNRRGIVDAFGACIKLATGGKKAARELADDAVRKSPKNAACHARRGFVLSSVGNYQNAVAAYQIASTLDPTNSRIRNNLATNLLRAGDFEAALSELNLLLKMATPSARA